MTIKLSCKHAESHGELVTMVYDDRALPLKDVVLIAKLSIRANGMQELTILQFDPRRFVLEVEVVSWWQTRQETGHQWRNDMYVYKFVADNRHEFIALRDELAPVLLRHDTKYPLDVAPE